MKDFASSANDSRNVRFFTLGCHFNDPLPFSSICLIPLPIPYYEVTLLDQEVLMADSKWWAKGLIFENCSCQLVCPGHISFKQKCTYDRCMGCWAIHIYTGAFQKTRLDGLNTVAVFDTPQRMYDGDWTQAFYIDERADSRQREALETIYSGRAGGPWQILSGFVSNRLETRFVPIHYEEQGREKRMWIDDFFDTSVTAIRARDDVGEVLLINLFNQIHGNTQVLARGKTRCSDRDFQFDLNGGHSTYSHFAWEVR